MSDLISRKAAIDATRNAKISFTIKSDIDFANYRKEMQEIFNNILDAQEKALNDLPPAQPEKHTEERTETHACDLISRQAAIEINRSYHGQMPNEVNHRIWKEINELPSAQPEPCVDTIDALDESIKHFDDMAEECRRNANIEQNDYMDMRDDAAEYRQLSIWLNELKWLRERFQSQPDLSEYSDKLWKAAYERGRAEAQAEIVRCKDCKHWKDSDGVYRRGINAESKCPVNIRAVYEGNFYCADAERRTDG